MTAPPLQLAILYTHEHMIVKIECLVIPVIHKYLNSKYHDVKKVHLCMQLGNDHQYQRVKLSCFGQDVQSICAFSPTYPHTILFTK